MNIFDYKKNIEGYFRSCTSFSYNSWLLKNISDADEEACTSNLLLKSMHGATLLKRGAGHDE